MSAVEKYDFDPEEDPRKQADYLKVLEIIRGVQMMSPRPAQPHTQVASRLHTELSILFERPDDPRGPTGGGPGGWWLFQEPEIHLEGENPVIPDIVGWRRQRMPYITDAAAFTIRPDWVCEVLSQSTENWDRQNKLALFFDHGIPHIWLVAPLHRRLEVLRHSKDGYLLSGVWSGNQKVRAEPFEAVELNLAVVWPFFAPQNPPAAR